MIERCGFYYSYDGSQIGFQTDVLKYNKDNNSWQLIKPVEKDIELLCSEKYRLMLSIRYVNNYRYLVLLIKDIDNSRCIANKSQVGKYISAVFYERLCEHSQITTLLWWYLLDYKSFNEKIVDILQPCTLTSNSILTIDKNRLKGLLLTENKYKTSGHDGWIQEAIDKSKLACKNSTDKFRDDIVVSICKHTVVNPKFRFCMGKAPIDTASISTVDFDRLTGNGKQ